MIARLAQTIGYTASHPVLPARAAGRTGEAGVCVIVNTHWILGTLTGYGLQYHTLAQTHQSL